MKRLVSFFAIMFLFQSFCGFGQIPPTPAAGEPLYWDPPIDDPMVPKKILPQENVPQASELITPLEPKPISIDEALARRLKILNQPTKNLVLVFPEGMGVRTMKIARDILKENDILEVDRFPITGRVIEVSGDKPASVTSKSLGGLLEMISLVSDQSHESLFSFAKAKGQKVGLVTDSSFSDTVPSTFLIHGEPTVDSPGFPQQLLNSGAHILFGGGKISFQDKEKNLDHLKNAETHGYSVITEKKDFFDAIQKKCSKVFGLFSERDLPFPWEPAAQDAPQLAEMVAGALNLLRTNEKGFILVVHAGKLKKAQIQHDACQMVSEMKAIEESIKVLTDFVRFNPDTLALVVIGPPGDDFSVNHSFSPDLFRKCASSTIYLASQLNDSPAEDLPTLLKSAFPDMNFSPGEIQMLTAELGSPEFSQFLGTVVSKKLGLYFPEIKEDVSQKYYAEDVLIHALGSHQSLFGGVLRMWDLPKRMAATLGWTTP